MFSVNESIRLAEEEARRTVESNEHKKRGEYLQSALSVIATLNSDNHLRYSSDDQLRKTIYEIAVGAIHGTWARE